MSGVEFLEAFHSRPDAGDFPVIATSGDVRAARQLQRAAAPLGKPVETDSAGG
jgi:CheY-like chemotaxis protein